MAPDIMTVAQEETYTLIKTECYVRGPTWLRSWFQFVGSSPTSGSVLSACIEILSLSHSVPPVLARSPQINKVKKKKQQNVVSTLQITRKLKPQKI